MDFKEQKLKEFREQFYKYWDSFDQTSTCERSESFLRKALEEQEKDFENTMKVYHDNYYALEKRLRLSQKEIFGLLHASEFLEETEDSRVGYEKAIYTKDFTKLSKTIIALQPKEL